MKIVCPVCGNFSFEQRHDYDICDVCGWENDEYYERGGANYLSLNECKVIYELSLCPDNSDILSALKQEWKRNHGSIHYKYRNIDWRIDGDKASAELDKAVDDYMVKIYELQTSIAHR